MAINAKMYLVARIAVILPAGLGPLYLLGRPINQLEVWDFDWNVEIGIPEGVHGYELLVHWISDVEQVSMGDKAAFDSDTANFEYAAVGSRFEAFANSNLSPSGHTSKSSSHCTYLGVLPAAEHDIWVSNTVMLNAGK